MSGNNTPKGDGVAIFDELQVAGELKEYVNVSSDVKISPELKLQVFNFDDNDVLVITKKIGSPTEILEVKAYDDEAVKSVFTSFSGGKTSL
jgi:hypothetical protein